MASTKQLDTKELERQTAGVLAFSLVNLPHAWSWRSAELDMVRGPNGLCLSAHYMTVYSPIHLRFGFWNRRRIRRAFKKWKRDYGAHQADLERRRALLAIGRCLNELRAVA